MKLLAKCLFKDLKIGIFFYSMLLFWHDDSEGMLSKLSDPKIFRIY